jgi:hypothetical protein
MEIDWRVVALERTTGKTLWAKSVTKVKPKYPISTCNSYATETHCADAERVYAYIGATGTVAAFDHAGKEVFSSTALSVMPLSQMFPFPRLPE